MADFSMLLRGGRIVDGTGSPSRIGDVAIIGGQIASIAYAGELRCAKAECEIDAYGLIVAPGFIDAHTHDDRAVLIDPQMTCKLSQGVTTVITGNCGISLAPLADIEVVAPLTLLGNSQDFRYRQTRDYFDAIRNARPAVNVASLVGHITLRLACMDDLSKSANPAELSKMSSLLSESLDAGALGFSTGLFYHPNAAADIDEVSALASIVAKAGGIYATHIRDERNHIIEAIYEATTTSRQAGISLVISHHKCAGPDNHGRSTETLALIDQLGESQDIAIDVYPYAAGSTLLDPQYVDERIRVMVTWSRDYPEFIGRDISEIALEMGCTQKEAAAKLMPAGAIYFSTDEQDVRRILAYRKAMIGSDGLPHDPHPHPRLWGTFPRVLGHYCRDIGLFSLETAVHKMTGLPAETFRLKGRGGIKEGNIADIVIFDETEIKDVATFQDPQKPACGIDKVIVNGSVAWANGQPTGERTGSVITRSQV